MKRRLLFSAVLAAAFSVSFASLTARPVNIKPITIEPTSMQALDRNGNPTGPVIPLEGGIQSGDENPLAQIFDIQYDGRHLVPGTWVTAANQYSPTIYAGNFLFTNATNQFINWPMFVNDTKLKPAGLGKGVVRYSAVMVWGPAGGGFDSFGGIVFNPNTGLFRPTIDLWVVGKVEDGSNGFIFRNLGQGYRFTFGTAATGLNGGFYNFQVTFAEAGGNAWPGPGDQEGGMMAIMRKSDPAGAVTNLSGVEVGMPSFRSISSPTDPLYPGTNPSDSDSFSWVDQNADYAFATDEYDDWTDSQTPFVPGTDGGHMSAVGVWLWDTDKKHAAITVNLEDYVGGTSGPGSLEAPKGVTVTMYAWDPVAGAIVGAPRIVEALRNAAGQIQIMDPKVDPDGTGPLPAATQIKMYVKRNHWLQKDAGVFDFAGTPAPVTINLKNGDVNGDNEVGPTDFSILAGAFGTFLGDSGYVANADLNEDGEVGPADFAILAANFGEFGDAP